MTETIYKPRMRKNVPALSHRDWHDGVRIPPNGLRCESHSFDSRRHSMSDNPENLVLEHLRHIRGRVDQIADDMKEVKLPLLTLESSMSLVRREIIIGDETGARQQAAIDRIVDRLERIERRLELHEDT